MQATQSQNDPELVSWKLKQRDLVKGSASTPGGNNPLKAKVTPGKIYLTVSPTAVISFQPHRHFCLSAVVFNWTVREEFLYVCKKTVCPTSHKGPVIYHPSKISDSRGCEMITLASDAIKWGTGNQKYPPGRQKNLNLSQAWLLRP